MNYVFYDLETTGRSPAWDQIIQVAAIVTDEDLNIKEKFEEKCRLNFSCIPNPEAILVNKIRIQTLTKTNLSHYQLMLNLEKKFLEWSPAIFIGYNSIRFDEEFIRNAFFKTLFDPYFTIKNENYRFDLLDSVRVTNYLFPDKIKSLISEKGNPILKLDKIAPLNGIRNFTAHDALGDTHATLELAKIIKSKAKKIWAESISSKRKSDLYRNISKNPFCYIESVFGKVKLFVLSFIGEHPTYKWAICFDLKKDPSEALNLEDNDFENYLEQSPKVIKNIKLNKSPLLFSYKYMDKINSESLPNEKDIIKRNNFIRDNPLFKERLINYFQNKSLEKLEGFNQSDVMAEESIYKKFTANKDLALMREFHLANWENKNIIKNKFNDKRLTYFANMLIYEESPEYLEKKNIDFIRKNLSKRLLSQNNESWLTVYNAYKKIDDLREKCDNDKDKLRILNEINDYLERTESQLIEYRD